MISKTNLQIDEQILKTDRVICRHISNMSNLSRGEISQDILAQLRHFLEHISGDVETVNLDVDGADTDSLLKTAEEEIDRFFAR